MTKKYIILILLFSVKAIFPCTTAIVSGKFTKSGRPLLLKHRDSGFEQNKLMFFEDGKYKYIGLVNSEDKLGKEVWGGVNSEGFAIINSASYNLKPDSDTTKLMDKEGIVMKLALQECATIKDFENLLLNMNKPLGVEANFGVIDAKGGAAYYETNNFTFNKIDANDLSVAPFGYLIRTNYSFVTDKNDGYGYIRYNTANELFYEAAIEDNLSVNFILQDVSRSLKHSLLNVDLKKNIEVSETENKLILFQDFIPRNSSCATILIEGVKQNESPELATLWTVLGFQLTSVAIPTWVKSGSELPKLLLADNSGNAPLCEKALKLKEELFPVKLGNGSSYINISKVINKEKTGVLQKLKPLEDNILNKTYEKLSIWRDEKHLPKEEVKNLYNYIEKEITQFYKNEFDK
ncbi:MAG: hypothetical protein KKF62_10160 [Bacteroidetes bacterium]|nr:hypothetical protein [Bacteroidota bacterium]MBU1114039.1 hypothetical protein [Bacteroidota bacterium]MBU1799071.1 hypothetical protein [Bacteroidota bacterium]